MHNLKDIRKNFESFAKALEKRSIDIDFNKLNNCEIKFATIGHFYSINKRTYRNLDGKESTKYFATLKD